MLFSSGFDVSLSEIIQLAKASDAAYADEQGRLRDEALPAGWSVLKPAQLGLNSIFVDPGDSNYFRAFAGQASALVLKNNITNKYILSFRGTDSKLDYIHYPNVTFNGSEPGSYIHFFDSLLKALKSFMRPDAVVYVTGHSLGAGAANQLAEIADLEYGGRYASAKYVTFASPIIRDAVVDILNIGFEDDPVYKIVDNNFASDTDHPSSTDNLVWANLEFINSNQKYRNFDAHGIKNYIDAMERLQASGLSPQMGPDSLVVFDAIENPKIEIQDLNHPSSDTAFLIGQDQADSLSGRDGNDFLAGLDGGDILYGGVGNDTLSGGKGSDIYEYRIFDSRGFGADTIDESDELGNADGNDTILIYGAGRIVSRDQIATKVQGNDFFIDIRSTADLANSASLGTILIKNMNRSEAKVETLKVMAADMLTQLFTIDLVSAFGSAPTSVPTAPAPPSDIGHNGNLQGIPSVTPLTRPVLARIIHHAAHFCASGELTRAVARPRSVRRDRREDTRCATRLGLICHVGGSAGRTAPRPTGRTA